MKKMFGTALILAIFMLTNVAFAETVDSQQTLEISENLSMVEDNEANTVSPVPISDNHETNSEIKPTATYRYIVLYNGVNVRTGPGMNYTSIGHVNKGDYVYSRDYGVSDGKGYYWLYVTGPACGAGYVRTDMIRESN